ncbi:DNA repair helicase RAD25 [Binucleata daphniae]
MYDDILPSRAVCPVFKPETIVSKPDPDSHPLHVNYETTIYLDFTHPLAPQATDFLIAVSEPLTRAQRIHEYRLTPYSLYAAVSVGLSTQDILTTLDYFSKNYLPEQLVSFINNCTLSYGKIKLVIKNNNCFLEAVNEETQKKIMEDEVLRLYVRPENGFLVENVEKVKKRCIEIDYPLIEEYDFRSCTVENKNIPLNESVKDDNIENGKKDFTSSNVKMYDSIAKPNNPCIPEYIGIVNNSAVPLAFPYFGMLKIDLKPNTQIRSYQEICLNKMFSNGKARSGIIVLPCGSGKTLVGITAICTMKLPTLILCTSSVSAEQWKTQIKTYASIKDEDVCLFTSDKKEKIANILITTYTMLAYSGKRSYDAQKIIDLVNQRIWGLMILDEVHVVPATMFRKVVSMKHFTKLGLTATLVREDDKIEDLNFLIGPKLYEANWQDLSKQGHIAQVKCIEVWCKMTPEFYKEYLKATSRKRRVISVINPTKFQICAHLIKMHEAKGDKIIVFSDNVFALKKYAIHLNKPYIYGPTGQAERMKILKQFQTNPKINTIFLSKVGDTSIDLPEATVLIQISSHFGSRRQEAQRLGRILRAKKRNDPGFKVYFYSLVSQDTDEMFYSSKRQQFLVDQGYAFKIVRDIEKDIKNKIFSTVSEQKELLLSVLISENGSESEESGWANGKLKDVTGGEGMAYMEKKRR